MRLQRRSLLTGVVHERDLPVTPEELQRWRQGELSQRVWPTLSAEDREFVMTGITAEEWATLTPKDDDATL